MKALPYEGSLGNELYFSKIYQGVTYRNNLGLELIGDGKDPNYQEPFPSSVLTTKTD